MLLSLPIETSESNKQGSPLTLCQAVPPQRPEAPPLTFSLRAAPANLSCPAVLASCDLYDTSHKGSGLKQQKRVFSQFFRPEFPNPYYWAGIEASCGHLYLFQPLVTASLPPLAAAPLESSRAALSSHRPLLRVCLYGTCTSLSLLRTLVIPCRAQMENPG